MSSPCHMCGSEVTENGAAGEAKEGFECGDCGKITCIDCKSIGVGRDAPSCQLCRG